LLDEALMVPAPVTLVRFTLTEADPSAIIVSDAGFAVSVQGPGVGVAVGVAVAVAVGVGDGYEVGVAVGVGDG
jgi:hypothetical protein